MIQQIHVKFPGFELEALQPGQMRYVLARGGLYRERASRIFTSTSRITAPLHDLDAHEEVCRFHAPRLPLEMISRMMGFFHAAYELHGGEAALVLLYHPREKHYQWHCPPQSVKLYSSRGHWYVDETIHFDNPVELPEGFVHFGDAHSHVGSPRPSFVDRDDEEYRDGLHIIAGYLRSRRPDYHIDFVVDGRRFEFMPEQIFEALPAAPFSKPPVEWMDCIQMIRFRPASATSSWNDRTRDKLGSLSTHKVVVTVDPETAVVPTDGDLSHVSDDPPVAASPLTVAEEADDTTRGDAPAAPDPHDGDKP